MYSEKNFLSVPQKMFERGNRLRHNPELETQLAQFNVSVAVREPDILASLVLNRPARFESKGFLAQGSQLDNPAIILEEGASYCSLLVGVDDRGNVVTLHEPIVKHTKEQLIEDLNRTGFLPLVNNTLTKNRMFFLTATDVLPQVQQQLVETLSEALETKVDYLFLEDQTVSPESDLQKSSFLQRIRARINEMLRGLPTKNDRLAIINKILVIPKNLSATGKTEIIIPFSQLPNEQHFLQREKTQKAIEDIKEKVSPTI